MFSTDDAESTLCLSKRKQLFAEETLFAEDERICTYASSGACLKSPRQMQSLTM